MRSFRRLLCCIALTAVLLVAAPLKLYLNSGAEILVREYSIEGDRIRYYSLERSQWEEVPARIVDLDRTEQAAAREHRRIESMRAESAAERRAERKARTELHNIPIDDGVYWYFNDQATVVPQDDLIEEKSGKRKILRVFAPVAVIPGKRKLLVEGRESAFVVGDPQPIFFVRDAQLRFFGIVRLSSSGSDRLVQIVENAGPENLLFEKQEEVDVFRQQLASGVYRVWPTANLTPGEYAFIDYTPGEQNLRVWSFQVAPSEP